MEEKFLNGKGIISVIAAAIVMILIVANTIYLPFLSTMFVFVVPIPITIFYVLKGKKLTLITLAVSIIVISILYSPLFGVLYNFIYGIIGISLGYCIRKHKKNSFCIIVASIAVAISNIVQFIAFSIFINGKSISSSISFIVKTIKESFISTRNLYAASNAPKELIDTLNEAIKIITIEKLLIIIPVIIIASSLIQSYINYHITSKILKKFNYKVEKVTSLSNVYMPNLLVAFLIIASCLGIIIDSRKIVIGTYMAEISIYILKFVFALDGIAFWTYILRKKLKFSKIVSLIVLIIALIIPIFTGMYVVSGAMDVILNLRRLDPNPIRKSKMRE